MVVDPHQQCAKWIESLDYEYLGPVHPLDKIANNQRSRQRPSLSEGTTKGASNLIDETFKNAQKYYALVDEDKLKDPS